jgi:hypothetical protein
MNPALSAPDPMTLRHAALRLTPDAPIEALTPRLDEPFDGLPTDRDFIAMRASYRATGGTARGDDLGRLLEDRRRGDGVSLARLIVSGEVFGFEWQRTFWIPMFQFELRDLSRKPGPRQVLAELASEFDGWTLAQWFAQPNCWLNERRPVDVLDANLPAVLGAARADRFIAAG